MPMSLTLNLPTKEPGLSYLTLDNWKKGVITLIDQSRLPKDALKEAINLYLYEDGMPGPRPGVNWYGAESPNAAAWSGIDYYQASDGTSHLVGVAGGNVYRSTDNATTWTICTAATLTSGVECYFEQNGGYLYITNGTDNIVRYDGSTVLQTYTTLATPAAPTAVFAGAGTTFNHYYKISAVNSVGVSIASASGTDNAGIQDRFNFDATTNYMTVTFGAVAGALRYDIYYSDTSTGDFFYLGSTATTTYIDTGADIINTSIIAPTENSTQGPKVAELVNVGSRMYGVRDSNNKYKIWFTGTGVYSGAFSTSFDGGYLTWQKDGKYIPVKVADYRDGKGTPYATIWCKSADGQGCVLQMTLDTFTIGDVSITVPAAYKLPGSRGTPAPGSVVNVLNDYYFYNSQAFYNLGSRAQFLNLLSTDEISANIRPSVKQISTTGETGIASVYYDAKVLFSVPIGQSTNNKTMVYDTERKAWLPEGFSIGFSRFLKYTDTTGAQKLLCLKSGDTRLSEISTSIQGDYGVAFSTSLVTGLYPLTRNRFGFSWVREGEVEFSNPQGTINIELLGIQRSQGFSTTGTAEITARLIDTGWSSAAWSTTAWSDASDAADTFSESTIKRYFRVQKELNAVQFRVTTNTLSAKYIMRTLQTNGTETQGDSKPRSWRI